MGFVLMLHSILRWIIVVVGLIALIKFFVGWVRKSDFAKMDRGLSAGFSGLVDLQVTLGLVVFFWNGLVDGAGFPRFRIEHMIIMLVAAVVAHLPSFKKNAENKFAVALIAVVGALILIYVGVATLPNGWTR